MRSRTLYNFSDSEIQRSLRHAAALCARLQTMSLYDDDYRAVIEELIPDLPASATICPPFRCDHGHGIHLGEGAFVNYGCVFLDGGLISIGRHTLIGPACQIYTPSHPMDPAARRMPQETALPVTIGDDCWLGGGVIVCPGVTIGDRCIIAAGSIVAHDIPADSLAAGNPAVVKRRLDDTERQRTSRS